MRSVIACLACAACGPTFAARGPTTEEEVCAACEPGPAGPPGPAGRMPYRWVDATGAVVSEAAEPVWVDPATGYVWTIDKQTGDYTGLDVSMNAVFEDPACLGPAYFPAVSPRVPVRLYGLGTVYYVRPDSASAESITYEGALTGYGTCFAWTWPAEDVLSEGVFLPTGIFTPPLSPWVGPLHLEP